MCTAMVPADMGEAFVMLESVMGFLADADPAELPVPVMAERLRALERADAVEAVARARLLAVFSAQDGAVCDGQRSTRTWLVRTTRVTRGQAAEYQATEALAGDHQVLLAGLRQGWVVTKSVALQLAKWTRPIPAEYRDEAEGILSTAARAGADLRSLAAICAEIRARTAQPDPGTGDDRHLDRGVSLDTTLQDKWIGEYRARWAGHRAAASVSTGDGGAWLEGDAAREVVCDAMIIPVVTGDIDPGAVEELIALCVTYHQLRTHGLDPGDHDTAASTTAPDPASTGPHDGTPACAPAASTAIPGIGP